MIRGKMRRRPNASASSSSFCRDARGNVAMLFALSLVPLIGMAGAAVDYGNSLRVKAQLQTALDAAVIAGATVLAQTGSNTQTRDAVEKYMAAKFTNPGGAPPTVNTTVNPTGKVTADSTVEVPTTLMRVFGQTTMPVKAIAEATFGSKNSEVVIALDVTGSMAAGGKLVAAQAAAIGLVNTLFATPGAASKVKVAFVPFNNYVNIGTSYRGASWLTDSSDYSTPTAAWCEDTYPNIVYGAPVQRSETRYNDGVPYLAEWDDYPVISYGAPVNVCYPAGSTSHTWTGVVGSRNYPLDMLNSVDAANKVPALFDIGGAPAPMTRLTNNPAVVNTQIGATTASGETFIQPGLLWGWRLLSPGLPFSDGAAYGTVNKIVVLMTDGANTKSPTYPTHDNGDVAMANSLMAQTCANMKAAPANVTIFTIAFDVTDPTIQGVLSNCASGPPNYFNATTIADMQAAFVQIGNALTGVRLSR